MSPVALSADRRFHRARVKPARRRSRLKTLAAPAVKAALAAVLALLVIYRGGTVIAEAPVLRIDRIVVSGNHRLATGEVLTALAGLRGENLVTSDLDVWRERLAASPWVREATFRRSLPSTVEVAVTEREPIGIGRIDGKLFLVDERGAAIDAYGPQYADFDLPIIDGLPGSDDASTGERGSLAARVVQALRARPNVARRVSQIDVHDAHNAAVILNGDQAVIYLGDGGFLPRLESYLELATALKQRVEDIDYVDLRIDDRVYVRPSAGSRGAQNSGAPRARERAKRGGSDANGGR